MIIQLPEAFQIAASKRAAEAGFDNIEEYVVEAIQRELLARDPDLDFRQEIGIERGIDANSVALEEIEKRRTELQKLLLEGLKGEPIETTVDEFIADIRCDLQKRRAARKSS